MTRSGSVTGVGHGDGDIHVHVHLDLGDSLGPVLHRIDALEEHLMANIDELRAAQAAGNAGLDTLGALIVAEAAQVAQILQDLVDATGNQVTAEDVAAAQAGVARIEAAGQAVSGIAPDPAPV